MSRRAAEEIWEMMRLVSPIYPSDQDEITDVAEIINAVLALAVEAERKRAEAIVEADEEMDGPMPDDLWAQVKTRESAAEMLRACVRATKRSILTALRAGAPAATKEGAK